MAKRGRPKGSKNKPKHTEGVMFGDPKFPKRPPERDLTPEELLLMCAEWQRTMGNMEKVARVVGIPVARAYDIMTDYAKRHPEILEDPDLTLRAMLLMGHVQALAGERAKDNMQDLWGKGAVMTHWIAGQKKDAYHRAWKERVGAAASGDKDKIEKKLKELEDEIKQYEVGGEPAEGQADTPATTAGSEAEAGVGVDA